MKKILVVVIIILLVGCSKKNNIKEKYNKVITEDINITYTDFKKIASNYEDSIIYYLLQGNVDTIYRLENTSYCSDITGEEVINKGKINIINKKETEKLINISTLQVYSYYFYNEFNKSLMQLFEVKSNFNTVGVLQLIWSEEGCIDIEYKATDINF